MRAAVALVLLATWTPEAFAGFLRVKSPLPPASVEGDSSPYLVVAPGATVKLGGGGPDKAILRFRRIATPGQAGTLKVVVERDGIQVARLAVGGKLKDKVRGSPELAGPAVETTVDMPPGPRSVVITVGAGKGSLLVYARVASEPPPQPGGIDIAVVPLTMAKKPASPGASKLEDEGTPVKRPGKLQEDETPREASRLATDEETEVAAPRPKVEVARTTTPSTPQVALAATARLGRLGLAARAGVAVHLQLGVPGPALGIAVDRPFGDSLAVHVSADYVAAGVSYGASLGGPGQSHGDFQTSLWSLAILAGGTWRPGAALGPVQPYVGASVGLILAGVYTGPAGGDGVGGIGARLGAAAFVGASVRLGPGDLALEVRPVLTAGADASNAARNLQAGGLVAQATYRYAL